MEEFENEQQQPQYYENQGYDQYQINEGGCGCGSGDSCGCGGGGSHRCKGSGKDKILTMIMVTNTITSLALAFVAVILVCFLARPLFATAPAPNNAVQQKQEAKPLFTGKEMKLDEAMKQKKVIAVLFYADWCQHCQKFSPIYKKLSEDKDLKKLYNFVPIDTQDEKMKPYVDEYEVNSFPSLFLVNPKTGVKTFVPNNVLSHEEAFDVLKEVMTGYAQKMAEEK